MAVPVICWAASLYFKTRTPANPLKKKKKTDCLPYEELYRVCDHSKNMPSKTSLGNLVLEKTPQGFVQMRYNQDEEGFEYWADANIDYKYLDTVARKYTHLFNCRGVYINRFEMLKQKLATISQEIAKNIRQLALEKEMTVHPKREGRADDDLFLKLKAAPVAARSRKLKVKITRKDLVCDIANKFICRGKLRDGKKWDSEPSKVDSTNLGWLEWKQLKGC